MVRSPKINLFSFPVIWIVYIFSLATFFTMSSAYDDPEIMTHEVNEFDHSLNINYMDGLPSLSMMESSLKFKIEDNQFVLKSQNEKNSSKEVQLLSGEFHYARIVPQFWLERLRSYENLGLNAIQVYVPWNFHSQTPGKYDFKLLHDFLHLVSSETDFYVLLRPGPYICGEWEFGGLPYYLLGENPKISVRTFSEPYISYVHEYIRELSPVINEFKFNTLHEQKERGSIIMVQVENEYGFYGDASVEGPDRHYLEYLLATFQKYVGNDMLYYTTDPPSVIHKGSLKGNPNLLSLVDFGPIGKDDASTVPSKEEIIAGITKNFDIQDTMNVKGLSPHMCTEFYTGWLTHYGEVMANTSSAFVAATLREILEYNASVSLYMGTGGTNFGYSNGASFDFDIYSPVITSYDYNAPISEEGMHNIGLDGVDKFVEIEKIIKKLKKNEVRNRTGKRNTNHVTPTISYGSIYFDESVPLLAPQTLSHLLDGEIIIREYPTNMEAIGQGYGFILYRKIIDMSDVDQAEQGKYKYAKNSIKMTLNCVRDRAWVYLNGRLQNIVYRSDARSSIFDLNNFSYSGENRIDILVENMGRVNFQNSGESKTTTQVLVDPKGLWCEDESIGIVSISTIGEIKGKWEHFRLPLSGEEVKSLFQQTSIKSNANLAMGNNFGGLDLSPNEKSGFTATLYRGLLKTNMIDKFSAMDQKVANTFLDLSCWGKGLVWVNGFNLGRYWSRGPGQTLFVPGSILKPDIDDSNEVIVLELEEYNPREDKTNKKAKVINTRSTIFFNSTELIC